MLRASIVILSLIVPGLAFAQSGELKLPSFSHLQKKAVECVDLTIGPIPLHLAHWALSHDPDEAEAAEVLRGIKSVRIRSYEFDTDFVYSKSDLDAVRAQLSEPAWSQLAHIRDQKKEEAVDIYLAYDHDKIVGLAIVASEPRKFTVLNVVGTIDINNVAQLEKHFGLPDLAGTSPL